MDVHDPATDQPFVPTLQQILTSISKVTECEDIRQSENSVLELVKFLDSVSDASMTDPSNEDVKNNASEILSQLNKFLCSPSLDQAVIDTLSFELPKAVTKFAGVSTTCLDIVNSIIDQFIATCSPRDMLSILCEVLDSLIKTIKESSYYVPILSGLSKVLLSTQRRQFEQVKVVVPVVVKVLKTVSSESDDEDTELQDLFDSAISIADSIRGVCDKLDGTTNEKLHALHGLYILQIMVLVSVSMECEISRCVPLVSRLSHFFPYCHLSFLGLITGYDVDTMTSMVVGEDEDDDFMSCLSYAEQGASLSVIWGHIADEVAQAAEEDMTAVKSELRSNQTKRWEAIGMFKHILSSKSLPWEMKKHAIDFLLHITEGNISPKYHGNHTDCSSHMPSLFAALQAVIMVIIYTPSSALRKNAFEAFKRVIAEIPYSEKRDFLKAMITKTESSSMVAILLDLVRQELFTENQQKTSLRKDEVLQTENTCPRTLFWPAVVLELVDIVLRPPKGGPPPLPENGDAVLSALNLYRFALLTESKENPSSDVLAKSNLQKAYSEWLLPLRTLVTGIMVENGNDYNPLALDTVCALNPIELVLYRCIELVEQKLQHST